jgi:hypothetical protein
VGRPASRNSFLLRVVLCEGAADSLPLIQRSFHPRPSPWSNLHLRKDPFLPPRSLSAFTVAIYHSNMSYHDHSGGYPPLRDQPESQYPPPPGEEDDRVRAYHQRMPSASGSITLPSISPYDPQYGQPPNGYQPDPRAYQQDPYRPAPGPYRGEGGYPQEYGRGAPPQQQHMAFSQSAPRQRTAIACRYCRRRKVSTRSSP